MSHLSSHHVPSVQSSCPISPVIMSHQSSHHVPSVQSSCPISPVSPVIMSHQSSHHVPSVQSSCPISPVIMSHQSSHVSCQDMSGVPTYRYVHGFEYLGFGKVLWYMVPAKCKVGTWLKTKKYLRYVSTRFFAPWPKYWYHYICRHFTTVVSYYSDTSENNEKFVVSSGIRTRSFPDCRSTH